MILPPQAQIAVERIGWALLHFLWQGTAIAVFYAIVRRLLRHSLTAQGRYVLACVALLAMISCPTLTFLLTSEFSSRAAFTISVAAPQQFLNIVVTFWLAGVLAFSIRLAGGWRYAARLRSIANPASPEWQGTLGRIAARLGATKAVQLLVSPLVQVPTVIGWLRPAILLPVDLLAGLPAGHVEALLAHELAHIRRHDYLANVLQGIAETVLFYHPAVWWISEQIRMEREQCCDDLAVAAGGDALAYAQALAELELRQPRRWKPVLAANGGSLVDRIRRLIDPAHATPERFPGRATATAMALLCLVGLGVVTIHASQPMSVAHVMRARIAGLTSPAAKAAQTAFVAVTSGARQTLLYDPLLSSHSSSEPAAHRPKDFTWPAQVPARMRLPLDPPAPDPVPAPQTAALAKSLRSLAPESLDSAQPPEEPVSTPVFHTTARLVQVDVVARKHGSAVAGLTRDDFTVLDDGNPQNIVLFSATSQIAAGPAGAPLAPGTISNRLEPARATRANATVLLIDQRNTPQSDQAFVMQRIVKFLESRRTNAGQPDRIALYTFGRDGALHVSQEPTDDTELLLRAATLLKPHSPSFRTDDSGESHDESAPFELQSRVMDTTEVLQAVARHLASVPGRKNLIWITAGFPLVSMEGSKLLADFNPRMEAAARALTTANFAFYAVDALGLRGSLSGMTDIPDAASARLYQYTQFAAFVRPDSAFRPAFAPSENAMSRLASLTGGLTFADNDGIEASIQRALDDSDLGYTLGFYIPQTDGPAAWHKLSVKVNRPGIKVRYRSKYFVPGTSAPENELADLRALLRTPLDATELQLAAQSRTDESRPGFCRIHIAVDLHNVHLEPRNNDWVGAVDLSLMVEGSRALRRITGNLRIPGDALATTLQKGLWLDDSIAVEGGSGALDVVAQDRATGAAGTIRLPLTAR